MPSLEGGGACLRCLHFHRACSLAHLTPPAPPPPLAPLVHSAPSVASADDATADAPLRGSANEDQLRPAPPLSAPAPATPLAVVVLPEDLKPGRTLLLAPTLPDKLLPEEVGASEVTKDMGVGGDGGGGEEEVYEVPIPDGAPPGTLLLAHTPHGVRKYPRC